MFEGSRSVGVILRGMGDFMHLLASEIRLALPQRRTQVLGNRTQAPGRAILWTEGL